MYPLCQSTNPSINHLLTNLILSFFFSSGIDPYTMVDPSAAAAYVVCGAVGDTNTTLSQYNTSSHTHLYQHTLSYLSFTLTHPLI